MQSSKGKAWGAHTNYTKSCMQVYKGSEQVHIQRSEAELVGEGA